MEWNTHVPTYFIAASSSSLMIGFTNFKTNEKFFSKRFAYRQSALRRREPKLPSTGF